MTHDPSPRILSRGERKIVALLSWGLSTRCIANMTDRAPKTVENICGSAYRKLGIHSRVIVTRWAIKHGIDVGTPTAVWTDKRPCATSKPAEVSLRLVKAIATYPSGSSDGVKRAAEAVFCIGSRQTGADRAPLQPAGQPGLVELRP